MDAAAWNARYAGSADLEWGAEPNRWVDAQLSGSAPGRALDLAAGEGRNALWLASQGWTVTAVDFAEAGLDKGRRLERTKGSDDDPPVTWVCADVTTYDPPPAAFDLVLLAYLHLVESERRTVNHAAVTALAAGGVLLVIGHDTTNLTDGIGGPQDAEVLFTPDDVLGDLADTPGLRVELATRVRRRVMTPDGDRDAIDALVRLSRG
jgi:SAM-dependent methyltransferase